MGRILDSKDERQRKESLSRVFARAHKVGNFCNITPEVFDFFGKQGIVGRRSRSV